MVGRARFFIVVATTTKDGIAIATCYHDHDQVDDSPKNFRQRCEATHNQHHERGDPCQSCKIQGADCVKVATEHVRDNFDIAHGAILT